MGRQKMVLPVALREVAAFSSKDETRPALMEVHVTPEVIVATDSYRMIVVEHDLTVRETFSVPATHLVAALKGMPAKTRARRGKPSVPLTYSRS